MHQTLRYDILHELFAELLSGIGQVLDSLSGHFSNDPSTSQATTRAKA
jgi:hypothetical protein